MVDIPSTYGALLVGGFISALLSGVVTVQCFVYFKCYPSDLPRIKLLVTVVWFLDFLHLLCVCSAVWYYLISHFGNMAKIDYIPWSLALTIVVTAALTFLVHCFFVHRLYKLSEKNWFIAIPLAVLACLRLCAACLTTAKMIILKSLSAFIREFRWSFTLGLALSSALDILITGCLCYFLLRNRKEISSMHHIIDSLLLYAFENGSLTCAATIFSMICWVVMPKNLIFMGVHFFISKLYANSLLATLNTRKQLQRGQSQASMSGDRAVPILFPDDFRPTRRRSAPVPRSSKRETRQMKETSQLHINVEKTVECVSDSPLTSASV